MALRALGALRVLGNLENLENLENLGNPSNASNASNAPTLPNRITVSGHDSVICVIWFLIQNDIEWHRKAGAPVGR